MTQNDSRHDAALRLLAVASILLLVVAAIGAVAISAGAQDNDVQFEGGVELSGNPIDGTTYTYTVDDLESVGNLSVELEGRIASENREISKADLSNGDSFDLDVGGTTTADVDVEFTGKQQLASRTHSTGSSSGTVDVNRNGEYVVSDGSTIEVYNADGSLRWSDSGYSPNDVEITTDAVFVEDTGPYRLNIDDGTQTASGTSLSSGKIGASENAVVWNNGGTLYWYNDDLSSSSQLNPYDGGVSVDGDGSYTINGMANEGNSCYDCVYLRNGHNNQLWKKSFSTTPDVAVHDTGSGALVFVHAEDTIFAYDEDGTELWTADAPDGATGIETDGETVQFIVGSQIVEHSTSDGSHVRTRDTAHSSDMVDIGAAASYHTVTYGGDALAESWRDADAGSPSLSAGSTTWSHSGDLSTGETATVSATIDPGSYSADLSASGGAVDVEMTLEERTESVDPSVTVNGETTSYDGSLADGETTTLDVDPSAIQSGENTVNISVSDGVAGPSGVVGFTYSHDAQSAQSVGYSGETWSESYNVSRTFGTAQDDVELSIPFASDRVIAIRDVQLRKGGGSWQDVTGDATSYNGTTLNVAIGAVDGGESVAVRANGSKVDVQSGAIEVTDPTVEGNDLSTAFRVVDDGGDGPVEIGVGSTVSGTRLHHLASSSWTSGEQAHITSDEQVLELPEAPTGGEATVATAPLEISPETGDVVVSTDNASEPRFSIGPGEASGDVVSIRYLTATSGEEYALVDVTGDRVVDRGTASSPVTLETNDESSIYTIRIAEGGGGGGQVVVGGPTQPAASGSSGLPVLLLVVSVGGVIGTFVLARRFGAGRSTKWLVALVGLMSTFIVAELATPASVVGTLSGDLLHGSGQATMSVIVGAAVLVGIILLNRRLDRNLPTPIIGLIAAGVGFWMVSSIAPTFLDSLSSSLEEIGPLFWVALLVGGGYLTYRYIKARRSPDTRVTLSLGGE